MRKILLLAGVVLLLSCKAKVPAKPIAGVLAMSGAAEIKKAAAPNFSRSLKPGMLVTSDMILEISKGEVALEGLNGARAVLGTGKHPLATMEQFDAEGSDKRKAFLVGETAEEKQLAGLIIAPRYEPIDSGKLKGPSSEEAAAAAYFFSPHSGKEDLGAAGPVAPPPPWMVKDGYIHALKRPLVPGDGARQLVSAKGGVVVEFLDRATAFATTLKQPLDLDDVKRVIVIYGSATLKLPNGGKLSLGEGQEAESGAPQATPAAARAHPSA